MLIHCVRVCVGDGVCTSAQFDWLVWCNRVSNALLSQWKNASSGVFWGKRPQSYPSLLLKRTSNPLPLQRLVKQLFKSVPQYNLTLHYITLPHRGRTASCTCREHAFADSALLNFAEYSIVHRFCSRNHRKVSKIMAILKKMTTACWKNFQGNRLNKQMFFSLRALHKSAASKTFGISAAGEEAMPDGLIRHTDVGDKTTIKTLKEMPGPSTLSNLIEFFWRDGFSRIHEIQVMVYICVFILVLYLYPLSQKESSLFVYNKWQKKVCFLSVSQMCHMCVKWHGPLRKSAPGVGSQVSCSTLKVWVL